MKNRSTDIKVDGSPAKRIGDLIRAGVIVFGVLLLAPVAASAEEADVATDVADVPVDLSADNSDAINSDATSDRKSAGMSSTEIAPVEDVKHEQQDAPLQGAATQPRINLKPPGTIAYGQRVGFVRTLLNESSATRQIDSSAKQAALDKREEARNHLKAAEDAHEKGNDELAGSELITATKVMFEAVRLAERESVVSDKKQADFSRLLESVTALLDAHGRISEEKQMQSEGVELRQIVKDKVAEAQKQEDAGNYEVAKELLDDAYVLAKVNIKSLREGDTLVRDLKFDTPEEEYTYEIDRNESQKMLVRVLLKDKMDNPGMAKMILMLIEKSDALQAQAKLEAADGKFDVAIKTLEEATKNLTRALRTAGIYVPG